MRAPVASLVRPLALALAGIALSVAWAAPSAVAEEPTAGPSVVAAMASDGESADGSGASEAPVLAGSLADGMLRVSADVALVDAADGGGAVEPVVGSFTVDGLTYAIVGEGRAALVAVSPRTLAGGLAGGSAGGLADASDSGPSSVPSGEDSGVPPRSEAEQVPSGAASPSPSPEGASSDGLEGDTASEPMVLEVHESVEYDGAAYSVVSIGPRAFAGCDADVVTIPAAVGSVDDLSFRGSAVAAIEVAGGNPSFSSYDGMLFDADQTSLLLIPEGKQGAARIPKTASAITPDAFSHCASVTSVEVEAGSAAYLSRNGLLYDASGETLLRVPAGATEIQIADGCATVAAGSMEGCLALAAIDAPAGIVEVSDEALAAKSAEGPHAKTESSRQGGGLGAPIVTVPGDADSHGWRQAGFGVAGMPSASRGFSALASGSPSGVRAANATVSANGGRMASRGFVAVQGDDDASAWDYPSDYETWATVVSANWAGFRIEGTTIHATNSYDLNKPSSSRLDILWQFKIKCLVGQANYSCCIGFSKNPKGDESQLLPNGYEIQAGDHIYAIYKNTQPILRVAGEQVGRANGRLGQLLDDVSVPRHPNPASPHKFAGYYLLTTQGQVNITSDTQFIDQDGKGSRLNDLGGSFNLNAKWTHTVAFEDYLPDSSYPAPEEGLVTNMPDDAELAFDKAMTIPATAPSRPGYTFLLWTATMSNGETRDKFPGEGLRLTREEDLTFYAKWKPNNYYARLKPGTDSSNPNLISESIQVTFDVTPTKRVTRPTKAGYSFDGYYMLNQPDPGNPEGPNVDIRYIDESGSWVRAWDRTFDANLNAKWTPLKYTVNLKDRTGSNPDTITGTVEVEYGSKIPHVTPPTLTGHVFQGYFMLNQPNPDDPGGPYVDIQYIDANGDGCRAWDKPYSLNLNAKWEAATYEARLKPRTDSGNPEAIAETVKVAYGSKIPHVTPPVRAGYVFQGYFMLNQPNPDDPGGPSVDIQYIDANGDGCRAWDKAFDANLNARWVPSLEVEVPIRVDFELLVNWGSQSVDVTASGSGGSEVAAGELRSHSAGKVQVATVGQEESTASECREAALGIFSRGEEGRESSLAKVALRLLPDDDGAEGISVPLPYLYGLGEEASRAGMVKPIDISMLDFVIPAASSVADPGVLRVRYGLDCDGLPLEDIAIDATPKPVLKLVYEVRLADR